MHEGTQENKSSCKTSAFAWKAKRINLKKIAVVCPSIWSWKVGIAACILQCNVLFKLVKALLHNFALTLDWNGVDLLLKYSSFLVKDAVYLCKCTLKSAIKKIALVCSES